MSAKAEKAAGKKKPILPIIIAVVGAVAMMFVGKVVLGGPKPDAKKEKKAEEIGATIALEEFLVNLRGGGDHYLKTAISLGMKKGVQEEALKDKTAPIRDAILTVLSAKKLSELAKPDGKEKLKEELKTKINEETGEENVAKVYFTSFATQ